MTPRHTLIYVVSVGLIPTIMALITLIVPLVIAFKFKPELAGLISLIFDFVALLVLVVLAFEYRIIFEKRYPQYFTD